jgi:cytosine/adenosine deaminase-related metal-dependent hydrolase
LSKELLKSEKVSTIHFLEGKYEKELFSGKWKDNPLVEVLKEFSGQLPYDLWRQDAVTFLEGVFHKEISLLSVHNTFAGDNELRNIKEKFPKAYFVLCPSSNVAVENILPGAELFGKYKDYLIIGTDSVVTNRTQMSLIGEINLLLQSGFDLEDLLFAATLNGAKALGYEHKYGSFTPGKRPGAVVISGSNELKVKRIL